jgi:hypothetical protein
VRDELAMPRHLILAFVVAGGATACSAAAGGYPDAGAAVPSGPWVVDPAASVRIQEWRTADGAASTASSALFRRSVPRGPYDDVMTSGPCRLRERRPASCEACSGVCTGDGVCEPFPDLLSAGDLRITVAGRETTVRPDANGWYVGEIDAPGLGPGEAVEVKATGDEVDAFSTELAVVAPLELDDGAAGVPAEGAWSIAWRPAEDGGRVRLELSSDLHGGGPVSSIECDADDAAGGFEVPAAMLDHARFRSSGFCGECPTQTMSRYRGVVLVAGDLDVHVGLIRTRSFR